jgi:hypothetical protein
MMDFVSTDFLLMTMALKNKTIFLHPKNKNELSRRDRQLSSSGLSHPIWEILRS